MVEELTKQELDSVYRLIERTRGSGNIRKGTNEVTKSVERNEAKLVILADDVNPKEIIMHLPMICDEKKIPYVWVPTKSELGAAAGLVTQSSSVAIADAGDAKKLLSDVIALIKKKSAPKKEEKKEEKSEDKKESSEKPKEESKEKVEEKKEAPKEEKKKDSEKTESKSEDKKENSKESESKKESENKKEEAKEAPKEKSEDKKEDTKKSEEKKSE